MSGFYILKIDILVNFLGYRSVVYTVKFCAYTVCGKESAAKGSSYSAVLQQTLKAVIGG
jgi:hypothetical protein